MYEFEMNDIKDMLAEEQANEMLQQQEDRGDDKCHCNNCCEKESKHPDCE